MAGLAFIFLTLFISEPLYSASLPTPINGPGNCDDTPEGCLAPAEMEYMSVTGTYLLESGENVDYEITYKFTKNIFGTTVILEKTVFTRTCRNNCGNDAVLDAIAYTSVEVFQEAAWKQQISDSVSASMSSGVWDLNSIIAQYDLHQGWDQFMKHSGTVEIKNTDGEIIAIVAYSLKEGDLIVIDGIYRLVTNETPEGNLVIFSGLDWSTLAATDNTNLYIQENYRYKCVNVVVRTHDEDGVAYESVQRVCGYVKN